MITNLQPSPAFINDDPLVSDAFWYWHGASGRRYIHSVYPADQCPVMPAAVYISVHKITDKQFLPVAIDVTGPTARLTGTFNALAGVSEVHVHLLAQDDDEALDIRNDLQAKLLQGAPAAVPPRAACAAEMQFSLLGAPETATVI